MCVCVCVCVVPPAIDEANLVDSPRIVVNRSVLLECPVSGSPAPRVHWLKNGAPLTTAAGVGVADVGVAGVGVAGVGVANVGVAGVGVRVDGRTLEIARARTGDSGRYTCIASNEAGQLRRSFDLQVLGTVRLTS